MITKQNVTYIVNGEQVDEDVLNRPILQLESNVDNIITLVNSSDPFTQYTTTQRATDIAVDNAITFAIALS